MTIHCCWILIVQQSSFNWDLAESWIDYAQCAGYSRWLRRQLDRPNHRREQTAEKGGRADQSPTGRGFQTENEFLLAADFRPRLQCPSLRGGREHRLGRRHPEFGNLNDLSRKYLHLSNIISEPVCRRPKRLRRNGPLWHLSKRTSTLKTPRSLWCCPQT